MKSFRFSIITIACLLVFFSCKEKLIEVVEEVYPDDTPRVVRFYKESDQTSPVKEIFYYPNGRKQMQGSYRNEKRHGVWTYYYDNGNKWSQTTYRDGESHGPVTTWYESGQKRYEGHYRNGEKSGTWHFWTESGELAREVKH